MTTLLGNTNVAEYDFGNFAGKGYCRFIALESGTLDTLKWYLSDISGTYMRLAIYSDNAGAINDVLAQGVVSSPTTYTWMALTGLSVSLTKDTYYWICLLYTSPSPRDRTRSRMPSSA